MVYQVTMATFITHSKMDSSFNEHMDLVNEKQIIIIKTFFACCKNYGGT